MERVVTKKRGKKRKVEKRLLFHFTPVFLREQKTEERARLCFSEVETSSTD